MSKFSLKTRFLPVVTIVLVMTIWFIITENNWVSPVLFPSPREVWDAFIDICTNNYKNYSLLSHLGTSLGRLFFAFFLAIVVAVPLGLASGYNKWFRGLLDPVIEFYRPLPPLAYYTLLVLWLGIGNASKIALLFLACFAPIYIACYSAVLKVPVSYLNCAQSLGANKRQIFWHVILPAGLPDIFVGTRTAIGFGYTTLVAAEMVAARSGIGWMVLDASNYLRSDIVFVGIIIMGITGIVIDALLRQIEKQAIPWKGKD